MKITDIQMQKAEWKRKGWSIPELRGPKKEWFNIVTELVQLIGKGLIGDLSLSPILSSVETSYPWRTYVPFLKGVGLARNHLGTLQLSDTGLLFYKSPTKRSLANLLHEKYRLVGEVLELLELTPKTVDEVDQEICKEFYLDWSNLSNTRRRMDWLEVLDLIQSVGNRKWGLTENGKKALNEWALVSSDVLDLEKDNLDEISISPPPAEINELLLKLKKDPSLHYKRNTYNIWVPSPNRIENLRIIVQYAFERVSRVELFKFIEDEFSLKTSSVESMLPFLRADGLIEEVGRNIYVSTAAARAWCESGSDLDFIRIIHSHRRFVGEMIALAEQVITRNEIYAQAKKYGINTEKARWIMGFLLEAGLLEETQYLHVKATVLGMRFVAELPLMEVPTANSIENNTVIDKKEDSESEPHSETDNSLFEYLKRAARNPFADGKASGVALEEAIATIFNYMGFESKRIGGSGNTDVIVRWKDNDGKILSAIIDGKSKSSGAVTHGDISDVAIETHKEKNNAEYVAIVGPGFSGDTIKNHARKKGFALITDSDLIDVANNSQEIGLSLCEIANLFKVPNGLMQLNELVATRRREQEIITLVIETFKQEQDAMESLSARDLYFLLRRTDISPSLEELITAFATLSRDEIGILSQVKKASAAENVTYSLKEEKYCVNKLRALANAIEKGLL